MLAKTVEIPTLSKAALQRFWAKVNKESGQGPNGDCWEWKGSKLPTGYGMLSIKRITYRAHRMMWFIAYGEIPADLHVLHSCDNPSCVNPEHLWVGTAKDNARDREEKGRGNQVSGDRNGARARPECLARGIRNGSYTKPEKRRRGEHHGCSTLTELEVLEIRRQYAAGGITQVALGIKNGVTKHAIWSIVHKKTWTHI